MRRPARDRPLLAIAYDDGAVSPGEVGVALAELGDVVFLVPDTAHVAAMRPVLAQLGAVRDLSGDARNDAEVVRELAPDALVTFSERLIRTTAKLARAAELPYHSPDTALLLTDKTRQRAALRAAGVDDVRTAPLDSLADWPAALALVGLPAVVKPVRGAGSRHTHPVHDEEEALRVLTEVFADLPPAPSGEPRLTMEEMLVGRDRLPLGDYASVESLCGPEGVTHLAVSGKLPLVAPFREPGRYWPTQLPDDERRAVLDLVTRALEALGVRHGLTHTEVKLTPEGPRLVEVNGRIGGHVNGLARTACGVDLVHAAVLQALGRPTGLGPLRPDRVHFQHNGLAPVRPCRLVSVDGAAAVRAMAGISGYRSFVRPDERLPGGVMTRELDVLWGVADTHEEMVRVVRDALETLHYTFDFTDPQGGTHPTGASTGLRTVAASSCGAWQDVPAPEPTCEPTCGAARGLTPEPARGPHSRTRFRRSLMSTPAVASPVTALIDIIDGQRWDDLKSVLARDCVIERPGSQPMAGLDRIEHFYRNERQVRHGKHVVDRVVADEEAAACWGTFRGETPDGSVIEARFADTFVLADGLIQRRTTYVHAPGH